MSEMVERGVRALRAALEAETRKTYVADGDDSKVIIDGLFDLSRLVRAQIEAMREPTEAMVDAATGYSTPKMHWQCMIDEALK